MPPKRDKRLIELLFWQAIPLTGGGQLMMGIRDPSFAKKLIRLHELFTISRRLDQQNLIKRFPQDLDWLMTIGGYDTEQARTAVTHAYRVQQEVTYHNAMLVALLNENFIVGDFTNGQSLSFKQSVAQTPVQVPDGYWNRYDQNDPDNIEYLQLAMPCTKGSPAEVKLALLESLFNQEPIAAQKALAKHAEILGALGAFEEVQAARQASFRGTYGVESSDARAERTPRSNSKRGRR